MTIQTILNKIATPDFWFSGIICGILINIISHVLIAKFPNFFKTIFTRISVKYKTRTKALSDAREQRISNLKNNPQAQQFQISLSTNKKISAVIRGFGSLSMVICSSGYWAVLTSGHQHSIFSEIWSWVCFFAGALLAVIFGSSAFNLLNEAGGIANEVTEAVQRENDKESQH